MDCALRVEELAAAVLLTLAFPDMTLACAEPSVKMPTEVCEDGRKGGHRDRSGSICAHGNKGDTL
jgi:hypothetical protein